MSTHFPLIPVKCCTVLLQCWNVVRAVQPSVHHDITDNRMSWRRRSCCSPSGPKSRWWGACWHRSQYLDSRFQIHISIYLSYHIIYIYISISYISMCRWSPSPTPPSTPPRSSPPWLWSSSPFCGQFNFSLLRSYCLQTDRLPIF